MKATTRDLRLHTSELLAATDRGETVVITYRGKERAVLSRWQEPDSDERLERNPAFGLWGDQDGSVDEVVRQLRQARDLT
jgi:antitoxin (DNA-binding transcriptional repressor) of toxin-antitoxin stability system